MNRPIEPLEPIALPWEQIDCVYLDMDGTLLDLHFDNHFWLTHLPKRLAEEKGIAAEDAERLVKDRCAVIEGRLEWYCLDYWQDYLQVDLVALKHEVADRIALRHAVPDFLRHLQQQGKRVVLLTNAHQKSVQVKFHYVDLSAYFDRIITSHDLGVAKEHEDFWPRLEQIERFQRESTLFIDDNLQVLRAAKDYGIAHLLAIHEPDSKLPPKPTGEFVALKHYHQIM